MRLPFVVIGVAMVVAGIAVVAIYPYGAHHTIPEGGAGIALVGLIAAGAGLSMRTRDATAPTQFKCSTCGRVFGSEQALSAHSKDKHPQ
ncbi:C2H2-type zinc finger protein [Candidatus Bathyarchaeota archaeon]|nr:MAG: C2H2-type zinc finger protein [Candidatus Bathyarchaeota archaeon]